MTSRRRVFVPEKTHLTPAEKAFANIIQQHIRAKSEYNLAREHYRIASNSLYNEYREPVHFRPVLIFNKNYSLEARLERNIRGLNNRNIKPAQRAFLQATERLTHALRQFTETSQRYRNASLALRAAYQMPIQLLLNNRNEQLENRLKNRTIHVLQRRVRQKQTARRMEATSAFIRSMSKRKMAPNVIEKIVTSINRRR